MQNQKSLHTLCYQNMRGSSKDVLIRAINFCHHHAVLKKCEASQRISTSFISFLDQSA